MAHPLDPLSADEIRHVATALREIRVLTLPGGSPRSIWPSRPRRSSAGGGRDIGRAAHVICWNTADGQAYRALVSLPAGDITQWEHLPGIQPNMTVDEWHECDEMLRRQPQLIDALARRGITDMSLVLTDVWAYGAALVPARYRDGASAGRMSGRAAARTAIRTRTTSPACTRGGPEPHAPARTGGRRVRGRRPPRRHGRVPAGLIPMPPREVSPLHVSQPDGVSFTLDGRLLRWQNWELRLGFNYREGLVLHTVGFWDAGRRGRSRTGCRSPR